MLSVGVFNAISKVASASYRTDINCTCCCIRLLSHLKLYLLDVSNCRRCLAHPLKFKVTPINPEFSLKRFSITLFKCSVHNSVNDIVGKVLIIGALTNKTNSKEDSPTENKSDAAIGDEAITGNIEGRGEDSYAGGLYTVGATLTKDGAPLFIDGAPLATDGASVSSSVANEGGNVA